MRDAIVALATPSGVGAIGVIRVSGEKSFEFSKKLLRIPGERSISFRHMYNGKLYSCNTDSVIDEVLYAFFKSPSSYTGEDVVEIFCHGSPVILNEAIQAFIALGARVARPGEFTERAYLNGKMDLLRAEAINDIIHAHTPLAKTLAMNQLLGRISDVINSIHAQILDLLSQLEAAIDHGDIEESFITPDEIRERLCVVIDKIQNLLKTTLSGKLIRNGIRAAIVGAPNVGKSSIMNALLQKDRVIVSDIPGTTRDVIEDELNIMGIPVKLVDTAGIRDSKDYLEQRGIERSRKAAEESDVCIVVMDASRSVNEWDEKLLSIVREKKNIYVLNKVDLEQKTTISKLKDLYGLDFYPVSAFRGSGIESIEKALKDYYFSLGYNPVFDVLIANARHESLLRKTLEYMNRALKALNDNYSEEFIASDVRRARLSIEEITGKTTDETILDRIFSQFCIGK